MITASGEVEHSASKIGCRWHGQDAHFLRRVASRQAPFLGEEEADAGARTDDVAMLVRARRDDDVEQCQELARIVHAADGYPPFLPGGDLRRFLLAPESLAAWVAEVDGQILGQVALHSYSSAPVMTLASEATGRRVEELGVVARLLVSLDVRRQGIGRALLLRAAGAAVERGRSPVLDVSSRFTAAVGLYESCGWRCAGTVTVPLPDGTSLEEHVIVAPPWLVEPRMPAD